MSEKSGAMVERVARAMAAAFHDGDWDAIPGDSDDGTMCRLDYLLMARAAIEAMREPTEAMLAAVIPLPGHLRPDSPWHAQMAAATTVDRMAFLTRWQDGIDAALISERGEEK